MFWSRAKLIKMECASVVDLERRLKLPKGRKAQIARARREGVLVEISTDYKRFIDVENEVLGKYHSATAVHTGAELDLLHDRFPDNIVLLVGRYRGDVVAGTVLFLYGNVVHTQYLAANDVAREIGALDLVITTAIDMCSSERKWFDFGKSTEGNGESLNRGLIAQKEGFGGRTIMY